jgi:SAM-dependent methyltransferase
MTASTKQPSTTNDVKEEEEEGTPISPFEWLTSPLSLKSLLLTHASSPDPTARRNKALHVGCGSSTVGEFLVEELNYDMVVDVDNDEEIMTNMKKRWQKRCQTITQVDPNRLHLCVVDFTQSPIPYPDHSFDLVLDKSTLDCTLCCDNASASLLVEVYRCLAVGGVYVLISFHELGMLLPLLAELPGAAWDVTCTTLERQVESMTATTAKQHPTHNTTTSTSSSTSKPLNVLIARKNMAATQEPLELDAVIQHVHRVGNDWFQNHQPLLTRTRTQELQQAFLNASLPSLALPEAYEVMFTHDERQHLTYEHFLEDWQAFCENQNNDQASHLSLSDDKMITCEIALAFLEEMQ